MEFKCSKELILIVAIGCFCCIAAASDNEELQISDKLETKFESEQHDDGDEGTLKLDSLKLKGQKKKFANTIKEKITGIKGTSKLPDEVFVDHRESGCITKVKTKQNSCAASYIYAPTALLEWTYCKQYGKLIEFSEQYAIDCGFRVDMKGCRGGSESKLVHFYNMYGVEPASTWPNVGKLQTCAYGPETKPWDMGYYRANVKIFGIKYDWYEEYIPETPIIAGIYVNPDTFLDYKGGVDMCDAKKIDTSKGFSMLIVGSGRENGVEYWLVRNSMGEDWGEGGYYKIAKSGKRCFMDNGLGMILVKMYEEGEYFSSRINNNHKSPKLE